MKDDDPALLVVDDEGRDQQFAHPMGDAGGTGFARDVLSQNDELVAAQPRKRIGGAEACEEPAGHRYQELIAKSVTHAVVDYLEAIQIQEEYGKEGGLLSSRST